MRFFLAGLVCALCVASHGMASADGTGVSEVVGIMAATGEEMPLVQRLARAVGPSEGVRILPIAGQGPVQSLTDLLQIKGVDAALVPADTLDYMTQNDLGEGVEGKLAYVVRLASLDLHLVARREIASFQDLAGRTIITGTTLGNSFVAGQTVLAGLDPPPRLLAGDGASALHAVASGQADATLIVGRKPLAELRDIPAESGLHFIALTEGGARHYAPSLLTAEDYPQLVANGQPVETLSTGLVLAVFNWAKGTPQFERPRTIARAILAALSRAGGEPDAINLAAEVPGWARHAAARDALSELSSTAPITSEQAVEN